MSSTVAGLATSGDELQRQLPLFAFRTCHQSFRRRDNITQQYFPSSWRSSLDGDTVVCACALPYIPLSHQPSRPASSFGHHSCSRRGRWMCVAHVPYIRNCSGRSGRVTDKRRSVCVYARNITELSQRGRLTQIVKKS